MKTLKKLAPQICLYFTAFLIGPQVFAQAEFPEIKKIEETTVPTKSGELEIEKKAKEKNKSHKPENNKQNSEKEKNDNNQLSVGDIDRTGEWMFEFERQFSVKKTKPEFEFLWGFNMLQEFHSYNNADLRKLNSTNDYEIRTTDDQQGLALTRAKFDTAFTFPKQRVGLEMSFGFDGVWGSFQMQGSGNPGTRIARANMFWEFFNTKALTADLVMGRQFFSVGGIPNDYMLRDVLDALVFNVHLKEIIDIKVLGIDVYSGANSYGAGENDRWNDEFQYFSRSDSGKQPGLNGDVSTYRTGIVVSGEPFMRKLTRLRIDPRVYAFYARVRGNKGGADYSENGRIGNFSDNDWSALFGARAALRLEEMLPMFKQAIVYADTAFSTGSDLRHQGQPPADYSTLGFGGGAFMGMKQILGFMAPLAEADFFYAQGPQYDKNGNMISHGFISMRGDRIGGTLLRRYWGVRPSGYVNYGGIDDTPFDANRKSGSFLLHGALGTELYGQFVVRADFWHLQDTASTAVNFSPTNLDFINNPYVSRAELEAQKRFGKTLGQEINLTLQYFPNNLIMFQLTGALFIPGNFFENSIEDIVSKNGFPKGGPADADFMGVFLRSTLSF